MLSDAVRLIHCPRCQGSEVHLVRPPSAWESVLLIEPTLCHTCATILRKRMVFTQLASRIALGASQPSVPALLAIHEPQAPAVLVVDDLIPFSTVVREWFVRRGFTVFGAKSPEEALAMFQENHSQIALAVIGLVLPEAVNLDLSADLEHLRPGLPVLYLVGDGKSIARCSIEAQAPESVLAVPFTEEQLNARVSVLLDVKGAAHRRRNEGLWERLVAASDWVPSAATMLHVYDIHQATLAAGHIALLSAGNIRYAFQPTNCEAAPYCMSVRAQDVSRARCLIGQVSADTSLVSAA
jgi:DNA-binding response OmpR family regulator